MKKSDLVLNLGQRLMLLLCTFLVCFILTAAASFVIGRVLGHNPVAAVRISAVLQDILTFIIPAVVTAIIVTRRPADLLLLTTRPGAPALLIVVAVLFLSVPLQEAIIYWNDNITLPESLASFEATARTMEENAGAAVRSLMADTSIAALILNILIVGVLAGLSEELLFRGCFQRLLTTGGVNPHVAIWTVAICFSALHLQFFGFVPRMLLGAYFGYLLLWTRSLWVPVLAHILNNTVYVISAWHQVRANGASALEARPEMPSLWLAVGSLCLTAACLYILYRKRNLAAPAIR